MRPLLTEHASYAESLAGHIACWRNGLRLGSPAKDGGALVISVDEHLGADYAMLWRFLYVHHYCHAPRLWNDDDTDGADGMERLGLRVADLPFLSELAGANFGRGWWDPGWRVVRGSAAAVSVEKTGIRLSAPHRDVRLPGANGPACPGGLGPGELCPGEPVLVRFPSGTGGRMNGFYHVTGAAGPATTDALMRIYLNVRPAHAPTTVQRVVAGLNEAGIRFTLKIVNSRQHLRRRDNTVIYLAERGLDAALAAVRDATAQVATAQDGAAPAQSTLNPETPLFTRKIGDGISVAAEGLAPAGRAADERNWSFGESRCKFLARGLLLHAVGGCPGGCDMAEVLRDAFRQAGLDPERPYERPAEMAEPG
jgi:hypothetical protein